MARKETAAGTVAREHILSIIEKSPGLHVRVLSLLTGLSWNTCLHHLRVLERKGQLTSRKVQGKLCWFDVRSGAVESKEGTTLLRDATNLRLAQTIIDRPGSTQIELSRSLGVAASIVHRRVHALEDAGLLERVVENRCKFVYPTEALAPVTQDAHLGGTPDSMPFAPEMPTGQTVSVL